MVILKKTILTETITQLHRKNKVVCSLLVFFELYKEAHEQTSTTNSI